MALTIEEYATVLAELSSGLEPRELVLERWSLTEESWERLDAEKQRELDQEPAATGAQASGGDVPDVVRRFASAFGAALETSRAVEMDFESYRHLTKRLQAGADAKHLTETGALDLGVYLRAHRHWVKRMLEDGALRRRFEEDDPEL
jgi:hypothetical protein